MHVKYPGATLKRGFALLSAVAVAASLALTVSAPAQAQAQAQATPQCTLDNWKGAGAGKANITAGTQGPNNRRYGGPCGMRVALTGVPSYVADNSPNADGNYIVRFYTFLRDATGSQDITIFDAIDSTQGDASVVKVTYNPATKKIALVTPGGTITETVDASHWHSVEFVRTPTNVELELDGAAAGSRTYASSALKVTDARLGNISGAGGGGSIDFDDFDSRRESRPGRLCEGDTDGDGQLSLTDRNAVFQEIQTFGSKSAAGQPDYDEDGIITLNDVNGIFLRIQSFQFQCPRS